jgi:AcrR family transcriptional regulator
MSTTSKKMTFREQQFAARENAILDATNLLLADKGYDTMSMDDVADAVGVAKGSLYKHFASKESLAAATMIRLMKQVIEKLVTLPEDMPTVDRLRAILAWALEARLQGGMPLLPSTSKNLQAALLSNSEYVNLVIQLNGLLMQLIEEARKQGELRTDIGGDVILYSLYARCCDPALDYLIHVNGMDGNKAMENLMAIFFEGIRG